MESQSLQRKTEEPASSSQSDFSSQSTIIQSLDTIPKGPVQGWLQEAPSIIRWLQGISPFHIAKIRLSIEKWLRELEETEETALLTQLAQSIFSFAETKAGRNFRLEDNDQHSKKSNKRICKAPEAKRSPAWKGIKARVVEAVDEELNENALTKASSEMPEVRLVIKSPYIGSEDLKTLNTSIRYPSQEHMFGVVQDTVNFTVKTNFRFDREPNIVSLEDADPRVLTLYLEHLPRSLDNNDELKPTWADAETILNGISSALAYLSKQKVIHYDVKPANIAFSRERGAILFDFDLGDHQKPKYGGGHGGTFGYLPPETIEPGKTRGFRGDVWALGVTILWIVGRYIPTNPKVDDVDDFHRPNSNIYQELERQLRLIDKKRNSLDRGHNVQDLVYKMLEPKSKARVAAATIHRKLQGGPSAKRRKYS
ncbi:uncharacterized protein TRIVIDRAFT_224528 [Trichoderma virens Gv29-8]|uniref:Protein kinase domain-containing protein n=1 Tax=Hypocrea virens (strain Gv29-8 / FGSC 10586) TaxID=413071 RepID=G9N0H6_HYPVG|nr:uncharacterized protein TRIVIDRAFT_224528 [Trichoderma virens Gv29-8]EHK19858.1 hypothetical protein TRIVIDRAFT_224528 [Trichoderma virens Gv29-8]UKZ53240.1 hypothetical protein TrVGV298_007032 [Trichoderma virens]